jgi:uncharacterized membrane protein
MTSANRWSAFVLGLFILQVLIPQPAAAQSYTVQELTIEDIDKAAGPNRLGDVVGKLRFGHGFKKASAKVQIEILGGLANSDYSAANGINDSGDVVGSTNTATSVRAFLAVANAGVRNLNPLPGDIASEAFGINDRDQVVGYSSGPSGARAVLWNALGVVQNLGTLPGGKVSKAFAINEVGAVVGMSGSPIGASPGFRVILLEDEPWVRVVPSGESVPRFRAFLWDSKSGMKDLGTLQGDTDSAAFGINSLGDVVGYSIGSLGMRAFRWTVKAGMQVLISLPGHRAAKALGISETGQAVGSSGGDGARAILWNSSGLPQDLNTLIPTSAGVVLMEAVGINARGQILALGRLAREAHLGHHEGPNKAFLLTPSGS